MTRITNFGRKRTYLEAGLAANDIQHSARPSSAMPHQVYQVSQVKAAASKNDSEENQTNNADSSPPPKKKRKRTKPSKRDGNTGILAAKAAAEAERATKDGEGADDGVDKPMSAVTPLLSKSAKKKLREKARKQKVVSASEHRRNQRIQEKLSATTCFACREKGHAAKDCPVTKSSEGKSNSQNVVGICYRCGSTKHTLSRCKKSVNQSDPLPYASCFVCTGKGHLAGSCPQNKAKGIYPDGGCCKLCGDNSHLAKDCGLRKRDVVDTSMILGTGREAGADEDDFHSFKRQTVEVDRDEKKEERVKRMLDVKTGIHSGIVKPFGSAIKPTTKNVVYF